MMTVLGPVTERCRSGFLVMTCHRLKAMRTIAKRPAMMVLLSKLPKRDPLEKKRSATARAVMFKAFEP